MKLIHIKGQLLLIDDLMTRMAKDLPVGSLVFCIDEFFSCHPEIRLSTAGDNCFGCQPLIAATHLIPVIQVSDEVLEAFKLLPDISAIIDIEFEPSFTIKDIQEAYIAGSKAEHYDYGGFVLATKNIWNCTATKTETSYIVDNIKPLESKKIPEILDKGKENSHY